MGTISPAMSLSSYEYSVHKFTYHTNNLCAGGYFYAEASTLGLPVGVFPKHIMLNGLKKRVLYERAAELMGDAVEYIPTAKSLEWTPSCKDTKIVIRNT